MALIECPECRKEISENAHACPNCGNPISEPKTKQQPKVEVQKEGCFLQTLNVGCIIIFAIIGIIILLAIFG